MTANAISAGAKAERALMHCLVTVPQSWWRVTGKVEAKHIAVPALRRLFELVGEVIGRNSAADVIEVLEAAESAGDEIRDAASDVSSEYAAAANIEHYASLVRDAATKRELQAAGRAILEAATEAGPAAEAIASAQQALASVMGSQPARWVSAKDAVKQVAKELIRRYQAEGTSALPTGFPDLDALVQLEGGRVYGIGARPKIGKSVLAANIASHLAIDLGKHVAIWTGEMPVREYMGRIIAHRGSIPLAQMANPRGMEDEVFARFTRLSTDLQSAPIQISDDTDVTIEAIEARARSLKAQGELDLLVIDYLGLLKLPKADRQDLAIGHITRRTKILAKELDVPVILVFQLSRASETGSSVRPPRPSDARDSGNIEQDLDVMLLLHRWSAYDANAEKGLRLEVALNRSGPSGLVRLEDRLSTASFLPYAGCMSDSDPFWSKGSKDKPAGKGGW